MGKEEVRQKTEWKNSRINENDVEEEESKLTVKWKWRNRHRQPEARKIGLPGFIRNVVRNA